MLSVSRHLDFCVLSVRRRRALRISLCRGYLLQHTFPSLSPGSSPLNVRMSRRTLDTRMPAIPHDA